MLSQTALENVILKGKNRLKARVLLGHLPVEVLKLSTIWGISHQQGRHLPPSGLTTQNTQRQWTAWKSNWDFLLYLKTRGKKREIHLLQPAFTRARRTMGTTGCGASPSEGPRSLRALGARSQH